MSVADTVKTRVLVTGATGFIGRRLVESLLHKGYVVSVLARSRDRVVPSSAVDVIEADITRPEGLKGIGRNVDIVIHCAALLGKWGVNEHELRDANVNGVVNLLQALGNDGAPRFVHVSAAGVTGPVSNGIVDETYPCSPATAYERTKFLGERKALETGARLGIQIIVARPTFTYGPGDIHKLPLFKAIQKGKLVFIGNSKTVNTPVYIDDLVSGILLLMSRGRNAEVYIIGGPSVVTKEELVYTIADELGAKRPRLRIPRMAATLTSAGCELFGRTFHFEPVVTHSRVSLMADNFGYSSHKAEKELGYKPTTTLREGVAAVIKDYKERGWL